MSFERPLRGSCQCGRNRYIIQFPQQTTQTAQVIFNAPPSQCISHTSPLAAFLRVPLEWYHSTTLSFSPDERTSMIHRAYTSPFEEHSMRHFCGFCGTPLSYWSEEPRSEADFIQLSLGSLHPEDLADLEDLGMLPDSDSEGETEAAVSKKSEGKEAVAQIGRQTVGGLPWLDTLVEGSRLGTLRASKGRHQNKSGTVQVEWEVMEWTEGDSSSSSSSPRNGKRKLDDREEGIDNVVMRDVKQ
ncbi:hypothetical protein SMACR_02294 [Sordaria macrospora]|uniref:WGS project CABT00000000 data, contig 2.23 n=2 Tax=Sordaria macrospora TaxID=5147 RepID=F7W371_SORMK|nr:uncharacterized protein SMAC_02294 [Sordaria macrospora k-hell]KAA8629190.1 hypothetical protein SMACR_02294 [Sordaria macrospora]WPJ63604.1 hypothetical protein SMAC4_02294 [Sordaria macrospora]CCC12073.1 unnamed protein product [Sordaria macrospora k-hell]